MNWVEGRRLDSSNIVVERGHIKIFNITIFYFKKEY